MVHGKWRRTRGRVRHPFHNQLEARPSSISSGARALTIGRAGIPIALCLGFVLQPHAHAAIHVTSNDVNGVACYIIVCSSYLIAM